LIDDLADMLSLARSPSIDLGNEPDLSHVNDLIQRARNPQLRIPPLVKPGDRILYHPAVQRFDRKVEGLGEGEYFIIREESVLAVIER
jgi:co-chaperonin GroES (HSP10)